MFLIASGNKDYIPGVHPVNPQPIPQHFLQHYLRLPPWLEDLLYIISDVYNPHIHDALRKGGHLLLPKNITNTFSKFSWCWVCWTRKDVLFSVSWKKPTREMFNKKSLWLTVGYCWLGFQCVVKPASKIRPAWMKVIQRMLLSKCNFSVHPNTTFRHSKICCIILQLLSLQVPWDVGNFIWVVIGTAGWTVCNKEVCSVPFEVRIKQPHSLKFLATPEGWRILLQADSAVCVGCNKNCGDAGK